MPAFVQSFVQSSRAAIRRTGMRAILLAVPALLAYGQNTSDGARLSAVMPLGSDSVILQPAKQRLNMLLSLECKEFANIKLASLGGDKTVSDLSGNPLRSYPRELAFRFTIGARTVSEEDFPLPIETKEDADHFQSNLHFRLKVFHGLRATTFEPVAAKIIGVPVEMPYDERIYHFTFSLPRIPVEDRMMLEVLDEDGNRVSKFHLQLM